MLWKTHSIIQLGNLNLPLNRIVVHQRVKYLQHVRYPFLHLGTERQRENTRLTCKMFKANMTAKLEISM